MKKLLTMMAIASVTLTAQAQTSLRSGIDLTDLNTTVAPGADFYEYACGGWMKKHPLPAAYSRYGSFDKLGEDNNKRINGILTDLLNNTYEQGTIEQKLSDLYKLAMDSVRREREGVEPVMPLLKQMEQTKTVQKLFDLHLTMAPYSGSLFFGSYIGADEKNATQNILSISQGGITLGQKEYYLDNDEATAKIREAYKLHIVRMFQLFGFKKAVANKKMKNIMKVETALAKVSKSRTELRDPIANYNKMTLAEFNSKYPHLQLERQMNAKGIESRYIQEMIVGQPSFMEGADLVFSRLSDAEMRDYMEWRLINSSADYLNEEVAEADFDFFGRTMSGRKENHPRWRRATNQVQSVMGEALGRIYVEKYFPASSKERMKELVHNLQIALGERIAAQDWMDDSTKVNALLKLSTFYVKIG